MSRKMTEAERRYLNTHRRSIPCNEAQPLTFSQAIKKLWKVIKFKLLPSKYLNKKVKYKGRWYKIIAETSEFFFIAEFPKQAFPKEGNKYPIR